MAGVMALRKMYEKEKPLQGARIIGCTHVNAQTAVCISVASHHFHSQIHLPSRYLLKL